MEAVVDQLLDHGVSSSVSHLSISIWGHSLTLLGKRLSQYDLQIECCDITRILLIKDEEGLLALPRKKSNTIDLICNGYSVYELATRVGWRRGCELLFEYNIEICKTSNLSLLRYAATSGYLNVLKFWVEIRPYLDIDSLKFVGALEDALDSRPGNSDPELIDTIISAMVRQRRDLESIARVHLPQDDFSPRDDRILDTQAKTIFDALIVYGVDVPSALEPQRSGVYYWHYPSVERLDALYTAGFREVSVTNWQVAGRFAISPLLWYITYHDWYNLPHIAVVQWYISKGADLDERWP